MAEIWDQDEEARRLAQRFEGVNQRAFAEQFAVPGGPSMLTQHKNGARPISLEAALAYARGFKVGLNEISPRLAQLVRDAYATMETHDDPDRGIAFSPELSKTLKSGGPALLTMAENLLRQQLGMGPLVRTSDATKDFGTGKGNRAA